MLTSDHLQILAFGDSITQGFYDSKGGWVQRLRTYLEQNDFKNKLSAIRIFNMGVSGNTSLDLVNRFESETKSRLRYPNPIFLFSIGVNDTQYPEGKSTILIPLDQFKENIKLLIKKAQLISPHIIFLDLTPVDEQKTTPCSWKSISYKNKDISIFHQALSNICSEQQISFINLYDEWILSGYKKLLIDGLHPNDDGHQKIFESVKNFIVSKNIISSL